MNFNMEEAIEVWSVHHKRWSIFYLVYLIGGYYATKAKEPGMSLK